jgi:cytochrome P450
MCILTNTWASHQNPNIWVRPNDFLPERWIGKPGDELEAPQGDAYCSFDIGLRSCLGQILRLKELRIVLIYDSEEL